MQQQQQPILGHPDGEPTCLDGSIDAWNGFSTTAKVVIAGGSAHEQDRDRGGPSNTGPDEVAPDYIQAVADQNGPKIISLTCDAQKRNAASTLKFFGGILTAGQNVVGMKMTMAFSHLSYDVLGNNGQVATVRIHGPISSSVGLGGIGAQIYDQRVTLVKERGQWTVCS